ncbi:MAG: RdgB/HAM1 family non-canonical purine NTP pyrophosphatase [Bacteroidota bacterium]|jgi:XTP/dITP diphosphohydrolase
MTKRIVVATGNSHKVQELSEILGRCGLGDVELIPMSAVVGPMEIEEDGQTFQDNAHLKAMAVFNATGLATLADDSGLCIDVLGGDPGVRSARYAGLGASDADNRAAVRQAMANKGASSSPARFVCVLCYVDPMRTLFTVGESPGRIDTDDRGQGGFGYDPMFTPDGFEMRYAEMHPEEKNAISHRGRAAERMADLLIALESDQQQSTVSGLTLEDLCRASIASALGLQPVIKSLAQRAQDAQQQLRLTEVLLQSYLFAGFPSALDALATAHAAGGSSSESDQVETYHADLFEARGQMLCKEVYGSVYEKMMARFEAISPSMRSWMIIEGYGKTLSRGGLSTRERELCIVSILAALGRSSQLYSHVRGALAVGATEDDLEMCQNAVVELCGRNAYELLNSTVRAVVSKAP